MPWQLIAIHSLNVDTVTSTITRYFALMLNFLNFSMDSNTDEKVWSLSSHVIR